MTMILRLTSCLSIERPPAAFADILKAALTFPNLQFAMNVKAGRSNWNVPASIVGYRETESGLIVPRGFIGEAIRRARAAGIPFEMADERRRLPDVAFEFHGSLKPIQREAVDAVLRKDFGTLTAATGSGKTVMALAVAAARRQPTLVVVHNKELLNQWIDRAGRFLGMQKSEIGVIGGGKNVIGERLTVAIVNSLYKNAAAALERVGFVICDEVHRAPSRTFSGAVSQFDCQYMLGLSATPWRRDGKTKLIFWHLGDLVHEVDKKELEANGDILRAEVVVRNTDWQPNYARMIGELCEDESRNKLIVGDVIDELEACAGICLVLSDRKEHCEALASMLAAKGIWADVLTGALKKREREAVVDRAATGAARVVIATGQLIGEGFDCAGLSTLFLATPIKFDGRLLQYIGRILRPDPGKEAPKLYDYVDNKVGVLIASAKARARVYESFEQESLDTAT